MHYSLNPSFERYQQRRSLLFSRIEWLLNLVESLDIPTLRREAGHIQDRFDSETLKILVVGEMNSGKSTIINALLRTKALPAYPVPTTALLTQVKRGGQAMAFLHHQSGKSKPQTVTATEIEQYLLLDDKNAQTRDFERIEMHLPLPSMYRGIEMIDPVSPWDDDLYEQSLRDYVPRADAVLYALDSSALPSKEETLVIDWIRSAGHTTPLFLCNRFDLVEPHNQKLVRRRCTTYLSQPGGQNEDFIFFTDAKAALEGYLQNDMQRVEQSQMPRIEDALYDCLACGSGEQSLKRTVASLQSIVSRTRQILLVKKRLQQTPVEERKEARAMLLRQCEHIEVRRQLITEQFDAARRRVGKGVKTAATAFYRECVYALDSIMQGYTPRQTDSLWYVFSGDFSERLAKEIITFLSETIRDRFQTWITTTLEPLLQDELCALDAELWQHMVSRITQAVERRINFAWHPAVLIKRMLDATRLEPGIDPQELKMNVARVYEHQLEESIPWLVDAIADGIDSDLGQRQQEIEHQLVVEQQCLSDVVRTSVEEEQEQELARKDAFARLLPALDEELNAIERVLGGLI